MAFSTAKATSGPGQIVTSAPSDGTDNNVAVSEVDDVEDTMSNDETDYGQDEVDKLLEELLLDDNEVTADKRLSLNSRLKRLSLNSRLKRLSLNSRLKRLSLNSRLKRLSLNSRLKRLSLNSRLKRLSLNSRLKKSATEVERR